MKKGIILVLVLLINVLSASASIKMKVTAENDFSSLKPSETMNFRVEDNYELAEYNIEAGSILHCCITKVVSAKRGKRNATFYVKPLFFEYNGQQTNINDSLNGKYSKTIISKETLKEIDKAKVAETAAVKVGGHFIKALGPAVSLTEGVIKNEEGNRIKSGVKQVYKDSALSYVEKGQELNIKKGDEFYLIFKTSTDVDEEEEDIENTEDTYDIEVKNQ